MPLFLSVPYLSYFLLFSLWYDVYGLQSTKALLLRIYLWIYPSPFPPLRTSLKSVRSRVNLSVRGLIPLLTLFTSTAVFTSSMSVTSLCVSGQQCFVLSKYQQLPVSGLFIGHGGVSVSIQFPKKYKTTQYVLIYASVQHASVYSKISSKQCLLEGCVYLVFGG